MAASSFAPAALLLASSSLSIGWLHYRPEPARPTLVVFAPGTTGDEAILKSAGAGANLVAVGRLPGSAIVQSDDPSLRARLIEAGAWLMLDATGRGDCASSAIVSP
jgi:hypothetical protein